MTETDSAEAAMAESLKLISKAKEIIATPNHQGMEKIVSQLFMRQETNEYQAAITLYDFCVDNFSDWLT